MDGLCCKTLATPSTTEQERNLGMYELLVTHEVTYIYKKRFGKLWYQKVSGLVLVRVK